MRGNDAYAVLGLRPGAGRDEIDQAYRRLIKRYHPDYTGGDASRAAEINRAYSDLRARPRAAFRPPPPPPPAPRPRESYSKPKPRWRVPLLVAAAAAVVGIVATSATMTANDPWEGLLGANGLAVSRERPAERSAVPDLSLDEPLATGVIESSVTNAKRLHETNDPLLAAEFSRECLDRLGSNPSVPLFDACAAYDEAIALLSVGNPVFESGPFNPLAVTARQVGAARLLSADDFEAETRLQQIRSRVQMALLPQIPDSSRASARRVATRVPAPKRTARAQRPAPPRLQYRPHYPVTPSPAASEPRPRKVAPAAAPPQRSAPPAARPSPAAAPAVKTEPKPAWQQPLKPAWQRPLPTPQR